MSVPIPILTTALAFLLACQVPQEASVPEIEAAPAGLRTGAPLSGLQPVAPVAPTPFRYTYEQLRKGSIDRILHGSGPLWTPTEHQDYRQAFARTPPYLVRFGISIRPSRRHAFNELVRDVRSKLLAFADQIPLITIKFDVNQPDGTGYGLGSAVVSGRLDAVLEPLARVIRDAARPVFVRIGPEVNGSWNGYDPKVFPEAYRTIVRLMRREGAGNTIFVWNVKSIAERQPSYMNWYPGDDWVDWWSIDLFTEDFRAPGNRNWVRRFLSDAQRHGKPVVIAESCPSGMDLKARSTWDLWFEPFFALINGDPNIKAFCYSNRDFASRDVKLSDWGDMRIETSPLADRWRRELAKPQYQHQRAPFRPAALTPQRSVPPR